jgi:hypothetical protein
MPGLNIGIVTVEPNYDALIPTLKFKIQITNATPSEPITGGSLDCDVYLSAGGKNRWLGKFISNLPISESYPLTQAEVIENFGLTVDINNAMFELMKIIESEDVIFNLVFKTLYQYTPSGTGVYRLSSTFYGNVTTISKTTSLPLDKWKRLLSTYYRNLTWIAISRETYLLLKEKAEREGVTLDEIIKRGLSGSGK